MNARRSPIVLAAIPVFILAVGIIAYKLATEPRPVPMRDFVEYYAAGVVAVRGGNPYDSNELLPIQREASGDPELAQATMMWNPPWALVIVVPLALFPATLSHLLWLGVQLVATLVSAGMLWRVYQGPRERSLLAALVALFFGPFFVLMWYGQVGTLCLLGLAGFLYFRTNDRPLSAGAFAALTALKPHLLFAFGLVLILDALVSRAGRKALLAGALVMLAAGLTAYAINPEVYRYYSAAGWETSSSTHTSPKDYYQPLGSFWLRKALAPDRFTVQFIPTAITAALVAVYWLRRRKTWNWATETPRLIFASVITAAYGAWIFDLVVLLVPVLQATVWLVQARRSTLWWLTVLGHFGLSALTAIAPVIAVALTGQGVRLDTFVYFSPAQLLLYLLAGRLIPAPATSPEIRSGTQVV